MKTFPLGSYVCPKQMSVPNTFALYKFTQRKMSVPNTFALYKFTQRKMSVPNTFALCKFTQSEMSVPNKFIARRASMGRRRRPKCELNEFVCFKTCFNVDSKQISKNSKIRVNQLLNTLWCDHGVQVSFKDFSYGHKVCV